MANDAYVQVAPDSTGKRVDASDLTTSDGTVYRQRIVIGDDGLAAGLAQILGSAPVGTEYALVVRPIPSGVQDVAGTVTADQGGTWTVTADQGGTWTVTADQGGSWTVTADQGGTWSVTLETAALGTTPAGSPTSVSVDANIQALHVALAASSVALGVSGTVTADQGGTWTVTADQGGTWTVGVSSLPALPAGTNVIGGVTQSGTWTVTADQGGSWTVTADQGGTWSVEITDGTNVLGTSTHPLRVDPVGTTTQPVSGTVTADQGGTWTVGVDNFPAVQAVSGTVTADQGSPPWSATNPDLETRFYRLLHQMVPDGDEMRTSLSTPDPTSFSDGATTANSTAFSSASADFQSTDVGLSITIDGAGASGANLVTTVSAVNSSTSVTLAVAASATLTNATWTIARQTTSNYFGMATDGTATTTASWTVLRIYQDANGNPVRWRTVASVAWSAAISGLNPPWT